MSNLQQPCPSCQRLLELPTTAIGRVAQCPACNATFTVTEQAPSMDEAPVDNPGAPDRAPSTNGVSVGTSAADAPQADSLLHQYEAPTSGEAPTGGETPSGGNETAASATETPATEAPAAGVGTNPFTSPLDSGLSGHVPTNPYLPSQMTREPVAHVDAFDVVPRSLEEVFSPTISIFASRWGILLSAFVLVLMATAVIYFLPMLVLASISDAGGDFFAAVGLVVWIPVMVVAAGYLSVGLARNAMAVARNSASPIADLLPPLGVVVSFLVGGLIIAAVSAVGFGVFAGMIALGDAVGADGGLSVLIAAVGLIMGAAISMVGYWLFWSWWFVVSDGQAGPIASFRVACVITMHNKLTSALLILIATVLTMAGASFCYVGMLITHPLTFLMFAVAYLLMTNQSIDDPRLSRPVYTPPPAEPTY